MAKTNHQTGYHKPVKNRTTNYGPMTGKPWPTKSCNV